MTGLDLDGLQKLADAGTPLPWVQNGSNGIHTARGGCIALTHGDLAAVRRSDAQLIVAAVNALPLLLAVVRDQAAKIERAMALPHSDWCCAKGCAGRGHCANWRTCSGDEEACKCVVAEVRAALEGENQK